MQHAILEAALALHIGARCRCSNSLLTASMQDQIVTQKDVQGAGVGHDQHTGQIGTLPETTNSTVTQPRKGVEAEGGVEQKQVDSLARAEQKIGIDPDSVEQQAGSFTKQLEGYLPRFHWGNQQQAASKSQKRIYSMCLNLRDVGANMPALMKPGIVFRSSELLRCLATHPCSFMHALCAMCSGRVPTTVHLHSAGHVHAPIVDPP